MSVSELRVAFMLSQSVSERVMSYRRERLQLIREADTPVTLKQDSANQILHTAMLPRLLWWKLIPKLVMFVFWK